MDKRRHIAYVIAAVLAVVSILIPLNLPDVAEAQPNAQPPPPGGREVPLRFMVPTEAVALDIKSSGLNLLDLFPSLDPSLSFAPGPLMPLPLEPPLLGPEALPMAPGPFKTLAILVMFPDIPAIVGPASFDTLLFGTGVPSLRSYYNDVSYNQLDIITLNLPSTIGWVPSPMPSPFYAGANFGMGAYPNNSQRLVEDIVTLLDPLVDFSQYDNNGDGWVDTIAIVHSGQGGEWTGNPNHIWSHAWWTNTTPNLDGVWVGSYSIEPEFWAAPGDMTHGVFAHEFGHAFGLPDLYDTDYSSAGIGNWSVMSTGSWNGPTSMGSMPAHLDAWSRLYLQFAAATDATYFDWQITLPWVELAPTGAIYRLNTGTAGEYFLLENRQPVQSDLLLPGHGLLIWHVDSNVVGNANECSQVNNYLCTQHFTVALEQADGLWNLENFANWGDAGDPYPGSSGNATFSFVTTPNTTSYYSANNPGFIVTSISPSGGTMTADIRQVFAPAAPSGLSGSPASATDIHLGWTDNSLNETKFGVERSPNGSTGWVEISSTAANQNSYTDTGLACGSTYYYRVYAGNRAGPSAYSNQIGVPLPCIPGQPTLKAPTHKTTLNDTTPTLSWNTASLAASYDVQIARDSSFARVLQTAATTSTSHTASPLANGFYYWRVRGRTAIGTPGPWSVVWSFKIDTSAPPRPPRLSPPAGATLSDSTPTFRWGRDGESATYVFQLAADEAFEIVLLEESLDRPRYDMSTPLLPGVYWWRVAALDEAGNVSEWSTATFTLVLEDPVTPPTNAPPTDAPPTDIPPTDAPPVLITPVPTQPLPPNKPGDTAPTPGAPPDDGRVPPPRTG